MRGDIVKIILSCAIFTFLSNNCSFEHVPPNTSKQCVKAIYQKQSSGGAQISESYNAALHSLSDETPGITYRTGSTMRACADGHVNSITGLHTVRTGGKVVIVAHGVDRTPGVAGQPKTRYADTFVTLYANLDKVFVEMGQQVSRGDPIGTPALMGYPKLLLKIKDNWESPDNWGPNHGLMIRRDDLPQTDLETIDAMEHRWQIQNQIIKDLYIAINVPHYNWYLNTHNPEHRYDARARWSLVEHMRYLECLYNTEPEKFTDMPSENYSLKRDEFYRNQPLILTAPF